MLPIRVVFIDRLMAITTRRHMVERNTGFEANGARHPDRTPRNAAKLNLTSCFRFPSACVGDGSRCTTAKLVIQRL